MIRLVFDARWLPIDDKYDGMARYSYGIAQAITKHPELDITWLINHERQLRLLPDRPHIIGNTVDDVIGELRLAKLLRTKNPDIVYSPSSILGLSNIKRQPYKLVLTVHDLISFHYRTPPHWLPLYQRVSWFLFHLTKWPMAYLMNRADLIATVSNTAHQEIIGRNMTHKPMVTVLNAVKHAEAAPAANHWLSNDVIYIGAFTPYKNVLCLIDALHYLPDVTLHLLSKIPETYRPTLETYIAKRNVTQQVILYNGVSDAKYHKLLSQARCLVTASKLEGFGLPIIEAQQAGTPVACSDTPIFREVAGEAAVFFDPNNPQDCADAIESLKNEKTSKQCVSQGHANAERFSWDKSAANLAAGFNTLMATRDRS